MGTFIQIECSLVAGGAGLREGWGGGGGGMRRGGLVDTGFDSAVTGKFWMEVTAVSAHYHSIVTARNTAELLALK